MVGGQAAGEHDLVDREGLGPEVGAEEVHEDEDDARSQQRLVGVDHEGDVEEARPGTYLVVSSGNHIMKPVAPMMTVPTMRDV